MSNHIFLAGVIISEIAVPLIYVGKKELTVEGRADFFVAELVEEFGEAMLVMECIQR